MAVDWEDHQCVESSSAQTVAVINELSITAHALRPPSCPPMGTYLVALRAARCGWSFARVTSACLGLQRCRLANEPLHSMHQKAFRSIAVVVHLFCVLTLL